MIAIIYSRCSTTEARQDTEVQLKELRNYCDKEGWEYDEVSEYASGSKDKLPPKLQKVLDLIAKRLYQVIIVYSMDRFSRQKPRVTEQMLNHVTDCNCRFISMQENLDSSNQQMWFSMKGIWLYLANQFSVNLSKKVKLGMKNKQEEIDKNGFAISKKTGKKIVSIGRPKGSGDKKPRSKKGYYKRTYGFKVK